MARVLTFVLLSQVATNGWWYCATQQNTIGETPIVLIPVWVSVVLILWFCFWAFNN